MTKRFKIIILVFLLHLGLLHEFNAQCKYKTKENDIITGGLNFTTEEFTLSNRLKKKKVYSIANLNVSFEKKGNESSILISYRARHTFGRVVEYTTGVDSIVFRFENGDIQSLKMNKMANFNTSRVPYKVELSYHMNEAIKTTLKKGIKIDALRITSTHFNIDMSELERQFTNKFNECWIE